jgi:hypothetical protein
MKDTDPKTLEYFNRLIMNKPPQERLIMGFSMFDTAKEIVKCSIKEKFPDISSTKMKQEIFIRFYGTDFDTATKNKILNHFNYDNHTGG